MDLDDDDNEDNEEEAKVVELINGPFLFNASADTRRKCIEGYIARTSNAELAQRVCVVCARLLFLTSMEKKAIKDLTRSGLLLPEQPHPEHTLFDGSLLHGEAVIDGCSGYTCKECLRHLDARRCHPWH